MKSLNARFMLAGVVFLVVMLAVNIFFLHGLIREGMEEEFDRNLEKRARALAALVEFDDEGLQFEWEHSPELVKAGAVPRWFQVRDLRGNLLVHSAEFSSSALSDSPILPPEHTGPPYAVMMPDGRDGRALTLGFTPKVDDEGEGAPPILVLTVAEPTDEMDVSLGEIRNRLLLLAIFAVVVGVSITSLTITRLMKPLSRLEMALHSLDPTKPGCRVDIGGVPSELKPLIDQLNALLARVDDTLRREQEFTAGAAHELRTPLAGIRGKLEVALSRERTPEQHREFAQSCLDISVQMQAIVENLLTLARSGNSGDAPEPVDLREALRAAWKPFAERAEQRGVQVDWEFGGEGMLNTRRNALHVIATNLFENAANYVNEGGRIEISAEAGPDGLRLEVANTGCTLDPNQVERVFEPFWRADEVRTGGQAHAGLGLAICRRLAKAAGGEISVQVIKDRFVATLTLRV